MEYFKCHSNLEYHKKCLLDCDNFLIMMKNPTLSIDKQIDTDKAREVMKNRKNLVPIIETIILCG